MIIKHLFSNLNKTSYSSFAERGCHFLAGTSGFRVSRDGVKAGRFFSCTCCSKLLAGGAALAADFSGLLAAFAGAVQVWSLTQFYYVAFSQSRFASVVFASVLGPPPLDQLTYGSHLCISVFPEVKHKV